MNRTRHEATREDPAHALERQRSAATAASLPDWPDQAVDACAPEGGHPPCLGDPGSCTTDVWS
jgi:hypothetical protein